MDYGKFFSADVPSFLRSPVREIFRKVDLGAICSFAGGYPAADTFPAGEIPSLSARVLEKYGTKALQYGATQGVPELREAIAARYGVPVSEVQITTSSQQGIDVCTRVFVNPGDIVLANNPVYLGALQSFRAYRATVMDIDSYMAASGTDPEGTPSKTHGHPRPCKREGPIYGRGREATDLEGVPSGSVKFIYVIPDFNNPSGKTMTLEEREEIVRIARELDVLIVEDSPYRELRYEGEQIKTIRELAPERTLQLGSFSKIFAPGFRLGWIIGPEELLEQIYVCKQCLDLCPPVFDQYLATEFLVSGSLERNLEKTKEKYRARRDRMVSLLEKYMPEGVSWTYPEGGLFLWLTLPENVDTVALYDRALSAGVAYVAGSFFYADGSHRNTMRLNFSFVDMEKMEPGVRLLAELVGTPQLYKFSGAGNDFVVLDGRRSDVSAFREKEKIGELCRQYSTDGLMILTEATGVQFGMEFYNPDGSGGMMCGNGGRCIVAFADMLGIRPGPDGVYHFIAPDGEHTATILGDGPEGTVGPKPMATLGPVRGRGPFMGGVAKRRFGAHSPLRTWTVRLKMIDVEGVETMEDGYFLNTGTRHFVKFVEDVDAVDVEKEGKEIRWEERFQPEGTNVNFVQVKDGELLVRTFEKGVEGETLACGTGLTASAIAASVAGAAVPPVKLRCRRGDTLEVDFREEGGHYKEVYLTGPAELVKP